MYIRVPPSSSRILKSLCTSSFLNPWKVCQFRTEFREFSRKCTKLSVCRIVGVRPGCYVTNRHKPTHATEHARIDVSEWKDLTICCLSAIAIKMNTRKEWVLNRGKYIEWVVCYDSELIYLDLWLCSINRLIAPNKAWTTLPRTPYTGPCTNSCAVSRTKALNSVLDR